MRFDVGALGVSFNPGVDMGIKRDEESIGLILMKDFDPLRIVFMIEEVDIFSDQFDGGLIDSSVQGDGSVSIDFTSGSGAKEVREVFGGGPQEVKVLGVAIQGRFFCRAMGGSMIGLITPLFESLVQGRKREGGRKKGKKLHS